MLRFILNIFGWFFSAATIGAVFVVMILGGVFWMYGRDLPDHQALASYEPATISRVYSIKGEVMDEFARERRMFTPADEIPDIVKQAFVSAEDKHFYEHKGYDIQGILKAGIDAARGGRLRGASTITQQVMKNFLLDGSRSFERKIKEIILASRLETTLSKDQILELYLNEIFLGQNSYGVTAAADTYFGKNLEDLSAGEAAYLASLPKSPSNRHPVRHRDDAIFWRNNTLREMYENNYISMATYEAEKSSELRSVQGGQYASSRSERPPRDYFTDEIRRQLSGDFGEEEFFGGGLTIRATMDPELQGEAAKALRAGLEKYDRNLGIYRGTKVQIEPELLTDEAIWREALGKTKLARDIPRWKPAVVLEVGEKSARIGIEGEAEDEDGHYLSMKDLARWRPILENGRAGKKAKKPGDLFSVGDVIHIRAVTSDSDGSFVRWSLRQIPRIQGGFMAMDTNTGRVLAMQGGFSYQHSVFNRATQAARQPGSSFKPFVYASALDSGYSPATIVVDAPIEIQTPQGLWRPKNASNKFYGPAPLRTGIERSRNLMTIRLAQDVGMNVVADYAERFGVYNDMQQVLANSLGAQETTLIKMVAAYAMFANGGERVEPTLVDRVQNRWGKTIYRHDQRQCEGCRLASLEDGLSPRITSDRERVMDAVTAYQLTSMMRGVVERGTASATVKLGVPVAGKTGTTNDAKDVWFVGFTPNVVAGCYMGYDRPQSLGRGASGGGMCGPVFNAFMKKAIKQYGASKFEVPPNTYFLKFDRFSGARLPDDAVGDHVVAELFREGEEPEYGLSIIDGGFAMGEDLQLFGEGDDQEVVTSSSKKKVIPKKATFGSLSSGGLY
ncbi:PBP1A family penicillin-binding protein [Amylibacter sp. IMCC11727]|uniref:penicillin-binding protein 1A n=1 Tax=Amylibacter sp. IMCC11727 TaxID=3039851 RepID=UPI00244E58E2|nr:PBP1A family penicillin-binding protein [Amylibacter sp. IMCC11727]WGI20652.1 PBP1A family penicillin-binding protein [Amylibacter sp. IMCC11727]